MRNFIINELGEEICATFDHLWIGKDNEKALLIENLQKNKNVSEKSIV